MTKIFNSFFALILLATCNNIYAQNTSDLNQFLSPFFENGFILLRQDYNLVNTDNDKVFTKDNFDYYGRIYTIGVRTFDNNFIGLTEMVQPWIKDMSLSNSDKFIPTISRTSYRTINSIEWERMAFDGNDFEEIVEGKLYSIPGSEETGFQIDTEYGTKKGFAIWIKSSTKFTPENDSSDLDIEIEQLNLNTKDGIYVYEIRNQPKNNVLGGFYLIPKSEETGKISFYINGLFQKIGGIWKFISLGTNMPNDIN